MVIRKFKFYSINDHDLGNQIFDCWYAYVQSISENFQVDDQYEQVYNQFDKDPDPDKFNILHWVNPDEQIYDYIDKFDLVLLDNGVEPLGICCSTVLYDLITSNRKNILVQCDSTFYHTQKFSDKLISRNAWNDLVRDCYTRPFYPFYYKDRFSSKQRNGMSYINGRNKSVRNYFLTMLAENSSVPIYNALSGQHVWETMTSFFETPDDTKFRDACNQNCTNEKKQWDYYDQGFEIGANGKFGNVPPGMYMLDLYYENHCVVYPETTWINNELCITEKSAKCFISGSIPFPIGGANLHQMFSQKGYHTAYHLLPHALRSFDTVLDHEQRMTQQIEAIQWLYEHQEEVFNSAECVNIRKQNYTQFFTSRDSVQAIEKFYNVVEQHYATKFYAQS